MNPEQRLTELTVIGPDRRAARPLHDERVVALTELPGHRLVAVFHSEDIGPGHDPHVRVVELEPNLWEDTVLSYKVGRVTTTPMPNPTGPRGEDRRPVSRSVVSIVSGRELAVAVVS